MPTFEDYYRDLLVWEGEAPQRLMDQWPLGLRSAIEEDFVLSAAQSGICGAFCPIRAGSTNQSVGNQVEEYVVGALEPHLTGFRLRRCPGSGYPDKMLVHISNGLKIPLEMKATGDWNPSDSNRRVLTSSSTKLRSVFVSPVYHLMATAIYAVVGSSVRIDRIRLDFLEPSTRVNVRLEASVSHRLLNIADHHSRSL